MKLTLIDTAWGEQDGFIEIERDESFLTAAQSLSDFMNSLPLSADQHNKLVELTIAQVIAAERCAFGQGLVIGREYGQYEAEEK